MDNATEKKPPQTFTDRMRVYFKGILDPLGRFLNRLGLTPNSMTLLGLAGNVAGALLLARGEMLWGGILILLMGPVDGLDGTMARLRGTAGQFGAFVDSVSDRYSELVIFAGLIYYYSQQGDSQTMLVVYAAAAGSVLVSYIRSRGQSLGWDTKVGILTRMERYLILAPALILSTWSGFILVIAIWIIAIFSNITAIQRIIDVRRQARLAAN
ncbi:MAG: putative phosphatidylinositol synthase [Chloroflexi bacterium]|nr:putative phosphatidylinositol synthase [Chloroflexota bacterium]